MNNQSAIPFLPKSTPITDDYEISNNVLGLGINGKVVECIRKSNSMKYALKVREKMRRESLKGGFNL